MGVVLLVLAIVFALWPQINGLLLGGPAVPPPPASDTAATSFDFLTGMPFVPQALIDLTLSPMATLLLTGVLAIAPIVLIGGGLAVAFSRLDAVAAENKTDPEYKEAVQALDNRWKDQKKEWKSSQPANPIPNHDRPQRFAAVTAGLLMMCAIFVGYLFADLFYPEGDVVRGGELVAVGRNWAWAMLLLTGISSAAFLRPQVVQAIEGDREAAIPWAMIFMILLGVLVLGIGGALILVLQQTA